jgi:hypothetical protein
MKNKKSISLPALLLLICLGAHLGFAHFIPWAHNAIAEIQPQPVQPLAGHTTTVIAEPKPTEWKASDQEEAKERSKKIVPFVDTVVNECLLCRQQKLRDQGLGLKDIPNIYFLLDSPIIKNQEDHYEPVRFMHAKHAAVAKDCAECHHYRPTDPNALETTRCSACHQESFKQDHADRIGLKAAYHIQCMECHKNMNKGPVDCLGCHQKNVPDHNQLVKLTGNPKPHQVTQECLRCHSSAGEDMLTTAHWLWKGPSPNTMEHRKDNRHGKGTDVFNNY